MLTAKDISERLARDVDRVVRYLLPAGKMDGGNWCVGSTAGDAGKSMRIQVSGSKAGLWCDFASGGEQARGDLIDLWAAVKGITLGAAIKEAKQWLGISDPSSHVPERRYAKPKVTGTNVVSLRKTPDTDVEKYLINERKLTRETINSFKVGQVDHPSAGRSMVFPSYSMDGTMIAVKYIGLTRDENGKKKISQEKDQAPCLFGWQAFAKGERSIILTEGQIDAMTWSQWGGPCALSIPNGCAGGGHDNWIDYEWDNLLLFDRIYISFDMDKEGEASAAIVARRLGIHRCFIVKLPHNDANECQQKGCTGFEAAQWLSAAQPLAPKEIRSPIEFEQEILEMENPDPTVEKPGLEFPILGSRIRFLPGEVTIWTGHSFHGKSTLLNQFALNAAIAGQGVAIGSFEMKGKVTCANLSKCLAFKAELAPVLRPCLEWMSGRIWIFDVIGFISQPKLKELILYSAMRHGVKHVIIDSLMKCDISSEDYEGQRKFFNEFCAFANEYGIHLHIVAHPRKGDHTDIPDIGDIHGGQAIGGQVDNIISVWRNIKKTEQIEAGKLKNGDAAKLSDAGAYIRKNRNGGDRFSVPLWYHKGCHRFTASAEEEPYYENYGIIQSS
jgi:twinkle protein